jgi:hypothetical protein
MLPPGIGAPDVISFDMRQLPLNVVTLLGRL